MASIFEATAGKLIGPTTGGTVTQATNKGHWRDSQRRVRSDHHERR